MASKSIAIDYDIIGDGIRGNYGLDNEINSQQSQEADYDANINNAGKWSNEISKRDPEKYQLVFNNESKKRNIISALRDRKIRRSNQVTDAEEKFKFAPILSVGACNK